MAAKQESRSAQPRLLAPAAVAAELGISVSAVYSLIRSGDLPAVDLAPSKAARRHALWRISRQSLGEFLSQRTTEGLESPSRARPQSLAGAPNHLGL